MHVFWAVSTPVLCGVAVVGLMLLATFVTDRIPVLFAIGVFGWVTSMWLFGHYTHWFIFTHYPFWLVFLAGVMMVAAIVAGLFAAGLWTVTVASLLVILLILYGLVNINLPKSHHGAPTAAASPTTTTPTSTTSTTVPAASCPHGQNVILDNNAHNRVMSTGLATTNPKQALKQILRFAGHDPRVLELYYDASPLGKVSPIKNWRVLVTKGCYNPSGRDKLEQLVGLYEASSVAKSTAPPVATNTGVTPGGNPFTIPNEHITGNRMGVMITFPNGSQIWVMKRCGNVVEQGPSVPGVSSQTPAPPSHPNSQQLKNCRLKDHNPDTDKDGLCASDYLTTSPSVKHRTDPGRSPGSKEGQGSTTHEGQGTPPSGSPPNTDIGSRYPTTGTTPPGHGNGSDLPGGDQGFTQPPAPPPNGTIPPGGDQCNGLPPGDPGSNCS